MPDFIEINPREGEKSFISDAFGLEICEMEGSP